ncbi:hypothetical protein [Brevundimonas nasdae]|uniref:hypothetical protein n=1 Tax=Brevundimonas nasdae TaxID=172043 RepID=UPI003F68DE0F
MSNVLPFPAQPTNRVRQSPRDPSGVLSSRAMTRLADRIATPFRAAPDRVADCLLALEAAPWAEPSIRVQRDLTGTPSVAVTLPGYADRLTPAQARDAAAALQADNAFAGASGLAFRLVQAADDAERRPTGGGPLNPRPNFTGRRFLIVAFLIAAGLYVLTRIA